MKRSQEINRNVDFWAFLGILGMPRPQIMNFPKIATYAILKPLIGSNFMQRIKKN